MAEFKTFPIISDFQKNIREEIEMRMNSYGDKNEPKSLFIRCISNARPIGRGLERANVNILMGGQLDDKGNIRAGFNPVYNFQRSNQRDNLVSFRPISGIESLSISNRGQWGSLRKATMNWKAPSLDDLETLSPYFLTPGMSIILEWGYSLIRNRNILLSNFINQNNEELIKDFFRNGDKLYDHILSSDGNYDAMIGLVTNFSYNADDDGGFSCTTEITSMGQMIMAMNLKRNVSSMGTPKNQENSKKTMKEILFEDFGKKPTKEFNDALKKGDILIHDDKIYFSWDFFEILTNQNLSVLSENGFKPFSMNSATSLVSNNVKFFSLDKEVMIIIRQTGSKFNFYRDRNSGWLAYVYVSSDMLKEQFDAAETFGQALDGILTRMNNASAHLWNLKPYNNPVNENEIKIIDLNYVSNDLSQDIKEETKYFKFGGITGKGITRNIGFETKMTNQLAPKFMFALHKKKTGEMNEANTAMNDYTDIGIDTLYGKYTDIIMKNLRFEPNKSQEQKPTKEQIQGELEDMRKGIDVEIGGGKGKVIVYERDAQKLFSEFLRRKEKNNIRAHQLIYPMNLNISIDGISGILPGNVFRVENIPTFYKENGIFQIIEIDHDISDSDWETKIKAIFRVVKIGNELR